jgi:RNase H-like domain found in reverse transcriptase
MLSADGLTMSEEKVQTIQDWPEPWMVKDIQSFLGFANFYCCFIHNYSDIMAPFTRLTQKGIPWDFTEECRKSFEFLKKAFTLAPILLHWVPDQPLVMEIAASDYALSATLSSLINPVNFTWSLFIPKCFPAPNSITMFMIRSFWQFLKHSNVDSTT